MTQPPLSYDDVKNLLLDAILPHVVFDGWSDESFEMAVAESGVARAVADGVCPRKALDLAVAYHQRGDEVMLERLRDADMSEMRFRDKVAAAVRFRLEAVDDKEAVRRAATLFALPHHAPEGARLIWGTCDKIWDALGDSSDDVNWYTKRASLSGVYSATVLYWLGDDSPDHERSWWFLDRRVDDVMKIEKVKAQVRKNPLLKPLLAGPEWAASFIKRPARTPRMDLPGSWKMPR